MVNPITLREKIYIHTYKGLPFWVWKENAALLPPVIKIIWNLSLSTQTWPNVWKEANVILPLDKILINLDKIQYKIAIGSYLNPIGYF